MNILTQTAKKMNLYFFQEETISLEDGAWFYGGLALLVLFGLFTLAIKVVNALTL